MRLYESLTWWQWLVIHLAIASVFWLFMLQAFIWGVELCARQFPIISPIGRAYVNTYHLEVERTVHGQELQPAANHMFVLFGGERQAGKLDADVVRY